MNHTFTKLHLWVESRRYGKRLLQSYRQIILSDKTQPSQLIHNKGTYVITGGLGGVGLSIAKALSNVNHVNLILLQRSEFPPKKSWDGWLTSDHSDQAIKKKIETLQSIEEKGSTVWILQVDLTNSNDIKNIFTMIKSKFTKIDGIIHAASGYDGCLISSQTIDKLNNTTSSKIKGTLNLIECIENEPVDFILLCSALISVTGCLGQLGYCAANNFLDSFAHLNNLRHTKIISVNWDRWKNIGMSLNNPMQNFYQNTNSILNKMGIQEALHIQCLWEILSYQPKQVITLSEPFLERSKKYKKISIDLLPKLQTHLSITNHVNENQRKILKK